MSGKGPCDRVIKIDTRTGCQWLLLARYNRLGEEWVAMGYSGHPFRRSCPPRPVYMGWIWRMIVIDERIISMHSHAPLIPVSRWKVWGILEIMVALWCHLSWSKHQYMDDLRPYTPQDGYGRIGLVSDYASKCPCWAGDEGRRLVMSGRQRH